MYFALLSAPSCTVVYVLGSTNMAAIHCIACRAAAVVASDEVRERYETAAPRAPRRGGGRQPRAAATTMRCAAAGMARDVLPNARATFCPLRSDSKTWGLTALGQNCESDRYWALERPKLGHAFPKKYIPFNACALKVSFQIHRTMGHARRMLMKRVATTVLCKAQAPPPAPTTPDVGSAGAQRAGAGQAQQSAQQQPTVQAPAQAAQQPAGTVTPATAATGPATSTSQPASSGSQPAQAAQRPAAQGHVGHGVQSTQAAQAGAQAAPWQGQAQPNVQQRTSDVSALQAQSNNGHSAQPQSGAPANAVHAGAANGKGIHAVNGFHPGHFGSGAMTSMTAVLQ